MASLHPVVILFLPLFTFYVQFAGAGETPLGCPCNAETECKTLHSNCSFTYMKDNISGCPTRSTIIGDDHTTTPRGTDEVISTCICADAFYLDTNNKCSLRIQPNKKCANVFNKDGSCVDGSHCNKSGVCVCLSNYKLTPNSKECTSDSSGPTVRATVLKPTSNFIGAPNPDSDSTTVITTGQTTVPTTTPGTTSYSGLKSSKSDPSSSTVKTTAPITVRTTTRGNSAATSTVVEISAIIMCFMLAYFNVSK